MLRRVPLEDVRLGMFVHAMEGSWLKHPFWRRSFLLDRKADLERLLDSDIPGVVVDDARSRVFAPPINAATSQPAVPAPAFPVRRAEHAARRPALPASSRLPCSLDEEAERATRIVGKSKRAVMKMFGEIRMGRAVEVAGIAPLVSEISDSIARNPSALIGIVRLKKKDEYTYMHSVAVSALMINLARTLELDESLIHDIGLAGLLHDIGKMAVPDPVLSKPGKLSENEFSLVREHPARGYDMLISSADAPAIAADVVLHHHERFDGTGYPHGLKGEGIGLYARMGAICDVYDAITSNRPYKDGWPPAESIARMASWQGHFDPRLLDAFIRSIGIYPVGTLVRLRSNRLGIVVGDNPREPTSPKVMAIYAITERTVIKPERVKLGSSLRNDAIVRREDPDHWSFGDFAAIADGLIGRRRSSQPG